MVVSEVGTAGKSGSQVFVVIIVYERRLHLSLQDGSYIFPVLILNAWTNHPLDSRIYSGNFRWSGRSLIFVPLPELFLLRSIRSNIWECFEDICPNHLVVVRDVNDSLLHISHHKLPLLS
jgi:hypothetical protein